MSAAAGNTRSVDALNIGLILISLLVAFKLPFELFLFSYAVLGPLHYITEINWLAGKNYFIRDSRWVWIMVLLAVLFAIPALLGLSALSFLHGGTLAADLRAYNKDIFSAATVLTFFFSISLVYLHRWQHILLSFVSILVVTFIALRFHLFSFMFLGIFLPTILHVYLFTLLFMIYGTLKSRNVAGVIAAALLLLCPLIIWKSNIDPADYAFTESLRVTFLKSSFQNLNMYMARIFGALQDDGSFSLISVAGIRIQVFVAFCYTYHYLNWFSKTSVIGWARNVSKPRLAILLVVWIASVGLYYYDYQVGFTVLLALSLVHVFFEFPLNIISVQGIAGSLFRRAERSAGK